MMKRDQLAICADTVKENVTALDTGKAMGLDIRKGRCRCPIHNGGDFNCSLSKTGSWFHCFSCGAKGDSIALVRQCYGMSFADALRWFNDAFNLGMNIDSSEDESKLKSAKKRLKRKAENRAFRERVDRLNFDMFLAIQTALERMEQQRDDNRPRRYGEDWNKAFCDAVVAIPELHDALAYFAIESTVIRK